MEYVVGIAIIFLVSLIIGYKFYKLTETISSNDLYEDLKSLTPYNKELILASFTKDELRDLVKILEEAKTLPPEEFEEVKQAIKNHVDQRVKAKSQELKSQLICTLKKISANGARKC